MSALRAIARVEFLKGWPWLSSCLPIPSLFCETHRQIPSL